MAELLIRDLEPELIQQLQQSAEEHGVSLEEEARRRLLGALPAPTIASNQHISKQELLEKFRIIRERHAHLQTSDSVDLIREDRNR